MKYRLKKPGHIRSDGTEAKIGEIINLTENQYKAFKDKFEPLEIGVPTRDIPNYFSVMFDKGFCVFEIETGESQTDPGVYLTKEELWQAYGKEILVFSEENCPFSYQKEEKEPEPEEKEPEPEEKEPEPEEKEPEPEIKKAPATRTRRKKA